jgi:crotonobetainyl-CoA:carnitine CoA-transferase CaiB-like acyl-CoA transferase
MASPAPASVKSGIAITDLLIGIAPHRPSLPRLSTGTSAERANTSISPLLDCVVTINSYQAINYFLSGKVPQRMGNAHSNMVPYQVFRCKEGDVIVAVGNDTQYAAFCGVIGRPDLAEDARFTTAAQRNRNRETLIPQIAEAMLARTMTEWVTLMEVANVPCGPIYNMKQVFEDPQVRHRDMQLVLEHNSGSKAPSLANPIRFSDTPIRYQRSAPTWVNTPTGFCRTCLPFSRDHRRLEGAGRDLIVVPKTKLKETRCCIPQRCFSWLLPCSPCQMPRPQRISPSAWSCHIRRAAQRIRSPGW